MKLPQIEVKRSSVAKSLGEKRAFLEADEGTRNDGEKCEIHCENE